MDGARVEGEAAAQGFEEGFLEGPELEEGGELGVGGESGESGELVGSEEFRGYVAAGEDGVDEFEVDADWGVVGDGDGGEVAGVGDVEMPAGVDEGGLALGLVAEGDFIRRDGGVAAEEETEGCAAGDETGLIFFEREAVGAVAFGGGEDAAELGDG